MKLFIQYRNETPIKINIPHDTSVNFLKDTLKSKLQLKSPDCKLSHRGRVLQEGQTLSQFKLQKNSLLSLEDTIQVQPQLQIVSLDLAFEKLLQRYTTVVDDIFRYFRDRAGAELKQQIIGLQRLSDDFSRLAKDLKLQLLSPQYPQVANQSERHQTTTDFHPESQQARKKGRIRPLEMKKIEVLTLRSER